MPSHPEAVRSAVVARLAPQLGDRVLAAEVAGRLDPRALDVLASQPDLASVALLSFSPETQSLPEALVVFAFGNRLGPDGERAPGPVNLELALLADGWVQSTGLPVVAQWEIADEMQESVARVGVVELDDGSVEYLSTAGVASQARELLDVDRVAVLAMDDHAVRCCWALGRVGFSAGIPEGVDLPIVYDPESGQPWTRDRATYLAIDILARCLT